MGQDQSRIFSSWGRVHRVEQVPIGLSNRHSPLPCSVQAMKTLPFGNGRSYGDSNLNPGGSLLLAGQLDRFISFDPSTGLLRCEAGVLLSTILRLIVPQGWFLPVTPGTQFVTVGGAIANDVHGKNHHVTGSFGNHVTQLELLRSDGSRAICSTQLNADLFAATVGGLGLTGLISWAEIQLKRIASPLMDVESIKFESVEEFFELSQQSARDYEYTVSWIDCAFMGKRLGRGVFNRANHAAPSLLAGSADAALQTGTHREKRVPITPPLSLINTVSLKAFNTLYFHKQRGKVVRALQHYRPFFYPLDALLEWNRIYGPKGFYQYQCVIPETDAVSVTKALLDVIARSGQGSFLAVLKQFGTVASRGMLSFPKVGTTLALDFPNQGPRLHALFAQLDKMVMDAGGRLYAAKDGRMTAEMFQAGYPRWHEFESYVDPSFSSGLWQRVSEKK